MERGDAAERGPHAGAEIEHLHADAGRGSVLGAIDAEDAREGLHHWLVPGQQTHRALVPVRPQRAVDEPRIEARERRGVQSEFVQRARTQVLDQHVRLGQARLQPFDRGRILQVERDAALVPVHRLERGRGTLPERRAPAARVVTALRALDLEHVGAHRREDLARVRAGQVLGDLDDLDADQRQGSGAVVARLLVRVHSELHGAVFDRPPAPTGTRPPAWASRRSSGPDGSGWSWRSGPRDCVARGMRTTSVPADPPPAPRRTRRRADGRRSGRRCPARWPARRRASSPRTVPASEIAPGRSTGSRPACRCR